MRPGGFYKLVNGELVGGKRIHGPNGLRLLARDKDTYTYPVRGWVWYDNEDLARAALGLPDTATEETQKEEDLVLTEFRRHKAERVASGEEPVFVLPSFSKIAFNLFADPKKPAWYKRVWAWLKGLVGK